MVDCIQIMRENSQAFLCNLETTDFDIKDMTKVFLLQNEGSLFYLETSDVEVTRVLLAQVLIDFKKDTILKNKLNEILFTDFSSFTKMTSEQNEEFLEEFPDLLICILDNEEELSKQSHILETGINIIKVHGKKIILIVKNPKHLKKIIMDKMANIFELKVDKLWKDNEMMTSTSHGEVTTMEADLKNLLQSLGVNELDAVVNEKGDTELHLAACDGKTEIVESLLVHGAKKDVKNSYGETALHVAAAKGHTTTVQMLLEHGFNVNAVNIHGWIPLHYASYYHNNVDLIEILLKFGAEMERKNIYGRNALHRASSRGHSAVVKLLLKNGANINAQDSNGDTPLNDAITENKQEVFLILLQHGAHLNIENIQQQNAIDVARCWGRTEIIQILENHIFMMLKIIKQYLSINCEIFF